MTVTVYLPVKTAEIISDIAQGNASMSRLIAIAVDNELDAPTPFNYECELPKAPFVPYAYSTEASRLAIYIGAYFPTGATLESIMLCRRQFNVPDRLTVMLAFRELMENQILEEFEKENRITGVTQIRYRVAPQETIKLKPVRYTSKLKDEA